MSSLHDLLGFGGSRDGGRSPGGRIYGVVIGLVTNNQDPEGFHRVRVRFPWFADDVESAWCRIASPMGGKAGGMVWIPEIDDEVLLAFEHGDPHFPYVLGMLWNGKNKPPTHSDITCQKCKKDPSHKETHKHEHNADGKNGHRFMRSRSGHCLVFDDSGTGTALYDNSGNQVVLDTTGATTYVIGKDRVIISAEGDGELVIQGKKITIAAQNDMIIQAGLDIKAKAGDNAFLVGKNQVVTGVQPGDGGLTSASVFQGGKAYFQGDDINLSSKGNLVAAGKGEVTVSAGSWLQLVSQRRIEQFQDERWGRSWEQAGAMGQHAFQMFLAEVSGPVLAAVSMIPVAGPIVAKVGGIAVGMELSGLSPDAAAQVKKAQESTEWATKDIEGLGAVNKWEQGRKEKAEKEEAVMAKAAGGKEEVEKMKKEGTYDAYLKQERQLHPESFTEIDKKKYEGGAEAPKIEPKDEKKKKEEKEDRAGRLHELGIGEKPESEKKGPKEVDQETAGVVPGVTGGGGVDDAAARADAAAKAQGEGSGAGGEPGPTGGAVPAAGGPEDEARRRQAEEEKQKRAQENLDAEVRKTEAAAKAARAEEERKKQEEAEQEEARKKQAEEDAKLRADAFVHQTVYQDYYNPNVTNFAAADENGRMPPLTDKERREIKKLNEDTDMEHYRRKALERAEKAEAMHRMSSFAGPFAGEGDDAKRIRHNVECAVTVEDMKQAAEGKL